MSTWTDSSIFIFIISLRAFYVPIILLGHVGASKMSQTRLGLLKGLHYSERTDLDANNTTG